MINLRWRSKAFLAAVVIAVICCSCASKYESLDPETVQFLKQQFAAGESNLDCDVSCSGKWGSNRHALKKLYLDHKWSELAGRVIKIGFDDSLSWYYLARAADGLNLEAAANIYYHHSLSAGTCKSFIFDNCDGLDTEFLATYRLSQLGSQLAQPQAVPLTPNSDDQSLSTVSDSSGPSSNIDTGVPLQEEGGTFVVPVKINDSITLKFLVDSGAADVSVPADVVLTLVRLGTITRSDFIGRQTYRLADGSETPSDTFRIRRLTVGGRDVENVVGSIAGVEGSLLLGQSFLSHFKSWSIDNKTHRLLLQDY